MLKRLQIEVRGRVQGVGFRPTVFRHATGLGLTGYVANTATGVVIEVEGLAADLARFEELLRTEPPPMARIDEIRQCEAPLLGEAGFVIAVSRRSGDEIAFGMPADLATCPECRRELFDPKDRRFGYPFLNCTNCGPRFTIIKSLPYDRARTTMSGFAMCLECRREYADPRDRRFDAQPTACPACGPQLRLVAAEKAEGRRQKAELGENKKNPGSLSHGVTEPHSPFAIRHSKFPDPLAETIRRLRAGEIGAIKGLGGFHLACLPEDGPVRLLRERKQRPHKPLAVMFRDLAELRKHCFTTPEEEAALLSPAAPVVLLKRRTPLHTLKCELQQDTGAPLVGVRTLVCAGYSSDGLSQLLAPDTDELGAFLAYTPLHHLLLAEIPAFVMTSANRTDEPIAISAEMLGANGETGNSKLETGETKGKKTLLPDSECDGAVLQSQVSSFKFQVSPPLLGTIADFALDHDRPILRRCDDSVIKFHNRRPLFIRRSRGYVPDPVRLPVAGVSVLACGADLKNTFCVTRGHQAFLSQHIGDLEDFPAQAFFNEASADLARLLEVKPQVIVHDLHPDYHSTRQAQVIATERGVRTEVVQHHHAHIAAVMAENGVTGPVIGVALDGTGYGTDGTIWGGEFLVADLAGFRRVAHFATFPLPGGEAAIREPARTALGLLVAAFGETEALTLADEFLPSLPVTERRMLAKLAGQGGSFAPKTSSAGRLFDAVAALLGITEPVTYEGQAAIRLQALAETAKVRGQRSEVGGQKKTEYRANIEHRTSNAEHRIQTSAPKPQTSGLRPPTSDLCVSFVPVLAAIFADLRRGVDRAEIALAFHVAVAEALVETCRVIAEQAPGPRTPAPGIPTSDLRPPTSVPPVALSGGVFQNTLLLELLEPRLESAGFAVLTHRQTPPNDACIALGQAAVALARMNQG